ncbi:MAG TPA: thioredoxin domain-containing protein [Longimicrobiales bacterium]
MNEQPGAPARTTRRRTAFLLIATTATLLTPAISNAQARGELQRAGLSRVKGDPSAPVLVYEIADFQCPYCARFSREVFPALDSLYVQTGKVRWIFVNLPLPSHPRAWSAAEAALCAGAVADRFWTMHNRLFADQNTWSGADDPVPVFLGYARAATIPVDRFHACLLADRVAPVLLEDVLFAAGVKVNGTPTFIIDRQQMVVGLKDLAEWKALLDEALRKKGAR